MATRQDTEASDASNAAPAASPVPLNTEKDAQNVDTSDAAADVVVEAVDPEKSMRNQDATVGAQDAAPNNAPGASDDVAMEDKAPVPDSLRCSECDLVESVTRGDVLHVCVGCHLSVHEKCYADVLPIAEEVEEKEKPNDTQKRDETTDSSDWRCDCCRHDVERRVVHCVYCGKVGGDHALKVVETEEDAAFWERCGKFDEEKVDAVRFGHVLCSNWDPRRVAAHSVKESKIKPVERLTKKEKEAAKEAEKEVGKEAEKEGTEDETTGAVATEETEKTETPVVVELEEAVPGVDELLMRDPVIPTECCFCHSSGGVRIQCRWADCAKFFHAMCAHQGNGHVELRTAHIPQFHAYCDRHRDCTEDIGDLLAKLITRPIRLLVGRDDMRRFGTIAKHLPEYTSAAAVMRDLAALMVGYCNKGLRACKSEPPDYNVKQLQVLQFFLSHVPQLEKVYALPATSAQEYVNDDKLFRRLERAFDPPRYLAKYPGPFSQQYTCDVCLDPFHERQHLFYCSGGDESAVPHIQHWRCTKRRSNVRERERYLPVAGNSGAKKKRNTVSIVQDGVRKEITLPKGLTSMTDDIICGVCRAPVDARGLIASRKEAKRLDFEKKESKFVQNGCYINPHGAKGYSYGTGSTVSSRKPPRSTDGKSNGNLMGQHAAAQQALGPPKMDRINVQRTTRWLTSVARIIRLVGAPAPKTPAPALTTASATPTNGHATKPAAPVADGVASLTATGSSVNGSAEAKSTAIAISTAPATQIGPNGAVKVEPETERAPTPTTRLTKSTSLVTPAIQVHFNEAMRLVRPYDSYALSKLETAYDMLVHRSGPGVAVLRMLTHEYTRFVYIKHTRAVEKVHNEKRKRAEHEAQEHREKERKRMNQEAERALKKQMLAMRNKQRQHLKASK